MFLQKLIDKNPALIEQAVRLHQQGLIPANSYLLDLDMLYYNAKQIKEEADRYGLKAFAMTKQIGRNPAAMRTLRAAGIDACVCVDMADARRVHEAGLVVGHLGHLVQVPFAEVAAAVAMRPLYWTVYSLEKAKEISDALPEGQIQNILL
ncbi:MAG: alanine racemase, partial [Ruthenibacterium sp.]